MPGKKPTSKALQPRWQGSNRLVDATQHTKPKTLIIGIGEHGTKTITHLKKANIANVQTATITTKPHKTIIDNLNEADTIMLITNLTGNKEYENTSLITQKAKIKGIKIAAIITDSHENRNSKLTELKQQWDTTILVNTKTLTDQLPETSTEDIKQLQQKASAKIIENMIEATSTPSEDNPDPTPLKPFFKKGENTLALQPTLQNNPLPTSYPKETIPTAINLHKDRITTIEDVDQLEDYMRQPLNRELNDKFTVTILTTEEKTVNPTANLSTIAPQLLNLEPHSTSKQKLPIDLNLHQMENF